MIIKTNQCHSDAVKAISSWVVLLHLLSSLVTWEETIESSTIYRQNFTICTGTPCSWFVMLNSWKDEFLIVSCCGENVGHVANSNSTFRMSEKPQETLGSLALRNSWCFSPGTCAPKRSSMVSPISKLMPCIRTRTTVDIWIMVLDKDFIDPCVLAIWLTGRPTPIAVVAFSSS